MDPTHVGFAGDEWCPSRIPFGKFKGRPYRKAESGNGCYGASGAGVDDAGRLPTPSRDDALPPADFP